MCIDTNKILRGSSSIIQCHVFIKYDHVTTSLHEVFMIILCIAGNDQMHFMYVHIVSQPEHQSFTTTYGNSQYFITCIISVS